MADIGKLLAKHVHLVLHKSVEETCPEVMYCILCGKTWTMEEWEQVLAELKGASHEIP